MGNSVVSQSDPPCSKELTALVDMGILSPHMDIIGMSNNICTRGCFCKILFNLCTQITPLNSQISFELQGTWKKELENTTFASYIAFFQILLLKNPQYTDTWGQQLLSSSFNASVGISKYDALLWLDFLCQSCFHLDTGSKPIVLDEKEHSQLADLNFISVAIYRYCTEIIQNLQKKANSDRAYFFRLWADCGEKIIERFLPNPEILRVMGGCTTEEYEMLTFFDDENTPHNYAECLCGMYELIQTAHDLPKPVVTKPRFAYQYTSLSALKGMLQEFHKIHNSPPQSAYLHYPSEPYFQLHMSNAEFLNDPDEGNLLLKLANLSEQLDISETNEIHPRQEYITCLTTKKEEQLPMWVQYGDGGKGCRIEFELNPALEFYQVTYVDRSDPPTDLSMCLHKIPSMIESVENKGDSKIVLRWACHLLRKYGYFYKDKYYQQEQEIRSVKTSIPDEVHTWNDPRPGEVFPRNYMLMDQAMFVRSVTLGPKCPNPKQIALALNNLGIHQIYQSVIHFQ